MAAKKKSMVGKVTAAVQDAASAVTKTATEHVVKPVVKAVGLTGEPKALGGQKAGPKPATAMATPGPATSDKPTPGKKSPAARMMTQTVAGKRKTTASRTMSQPVGDVTKPTTRQAGGGAKGPRRGASKGR